MSPDEFADFLTQDEIDEILSIESDLGVDINLDEIMSEFDEDDWVDDTIADDDDDDLELG